MNLVRKMVKVVAMSLSVFFLAAGSLAWTDSKGVYIKTISQGPSLNNPSFIYIRVSPTPAGSPCPHISLGRMPWNPSFYKALQGVMNDHQPLMLTLGPQCYALGVGAEAEESFDIRNFEILPVLEKKPQNNRIPEGKLNKKNKVSGKAVLLKN